ncbi:MAG: TIGR00374 family protein, partial [Pauljensenia sp.]|nr:TIGR00374 family protein [Pauljensenia sp.]
MRKRKESHDGTPVVDTNILFVPSSAEDPSALGVEGLMGMIDEAGAATTPAPPPEVPPSEARTEVMDAIVSPSTTQPVMMPPSFPPILATHPGPAPASPIHPTAAPASPMPPVDAPGDFTPPPPPAPATPEPASMTEPPLPSAAPEAGAPLAPAAPLTPQAPSEPMLAADAVQANAPADATALTAPPAPSDNATTDTTDATDAATDANEAPREERASTVEDTPTTAESSDEAAVSTAVAHAKSGEVALPVPARRLRLPRPAYIADRMFTLRRRREDVIDVVIALLSIVVIWTIGTVASATTRGVTMDVLQFQLVRKILILPVNLVEGLIILITPILVIVSLALRRRLQAIIQALVTSVVAAVGGWIIILLTGLLPAYLTAPLSVDRAIATQGHQTGFAIAINLVIVTLCALFTSAGEAQSMKAIRWGWTGLWIILVLGVLRSSMTLPVAFISVFIGRAFGSGSRWVMGFDDQRAKGAALVEALLGIGITPSRIVRTDLDTSTEPLSTWAVAENARGSLTQMPADLGDMGVTVTRRPDPDHHRHYQVWSDTGLAYELIVMDPGQELTGTLLEMWNNLRLRGISRWVSPSLKAQAERSSFTTLQALRAGVFTQEPIAIASANDSIIMVLSALPPTTPLTELGEQASDEVLDRAWEQLHYAHTRGISHRALTPEAVVVDASNDVWLLDWDSGEVATTELNQSIDIAQMLVLTALAVGPERALEAGRRCVGEDTLIACAPVIQKPVLPASINQRLRRSDLLGELRAALVGDSEAETAPTADLQRFRPRTIFT